GAGEGETFADKDEYEFLEIQNVSTSQTLDLAGFEFVDGITFTFPAITLGPGQYAVLVKNQAAFEERYGTSIPIAGVYLGNLNNAGEHVALVGPLGEPVLDFTYDDGWYPTTDGGDRSLVIADADDPLADPNTAPAWRASYEADGSPGEKDLMAGDINEDNRVDLVDLALLQAHYGVASGAARADGDFNRDGAVGRADLAILARNFGRSLSPLLPAPSPQAPAQTPHSPALLRASRLRSAAVDRVIAQDHPSVTESSPESRSVLSVRPARARHRAAAIHEAADVSLP
ncbi:MAG: lamin tail domain-containing protein, partial [Pirellulales bacterium]